MNDRDDLFRDDKLWRSVYAEVDRIVRRFAFKKGGVSKEVLEDLRQVALLRVMKHPERWIKDGSVNYGYCRTTVKNLFKDYWKERSKCVSDGRFGSGFDERGSLDGDSSQRAEFDFESSELISDVGSHYDMPGSLADEVQCSGHRMYYPDMTTRECRPEDPREILEVEQLLMFWKRCFTSMSIGIRKKVLEAVLNGVTERRGIAEKLGGDQKAVDQALSYIRKYLKVEAQTFGLL